jgi:hypothetical protein
MKLSINTFVAALIVATIATASPTRYQVQITEGENAPNIEKDIPLIELWKEEYEILFPNLECSINRKLKKLPQILRWTYVHRQEYSWNVQSVPRS